MSAQPQPHQQDALEIDQDLDFQEKEWRVERVAWATMSLLLVLALLGLFGTGPLSSATARGGDGAIVLNYERFIRHDGQASLDIEAGTVQKFEVTLPVVPGATPVD